MRLGALGALALSGCGARAAGTYDEAAPGVRGAGAAGAGQGSAARGAASAGAASAGAASAGAASAGAAAAGASTPGSASGSAGPGRTPGSSAAPRAGESCYSPAEFEDVPLLRAIIDDLPADVVDEAGCVSGRYAGALFGAVCSYDPGAPIERDGSCCYVLSATIAGCR